MLKISNIDQESEHYKTQQWWGLPWGLYTGNILETLENRIQLVRPQGNRVQNLKADVISVIYWAFTVNPIFMKLEVSLVVKDRLHLSQGNLGNIIFFGIFRPFTGIDFWLRTKMAGSMGNSQRI